MRHPWFMVWLCVGFFSGVALVIAKPVPRDGGAPHDMAALAVRVPRPISDAWNYNRLQRTVLETQRDRIAAELARLKAEELELSAHLKSECQVDPAGGDSWDERTLEIHRRNSP